MTKEGRERGALRCWTLNAEGLASLTSKTINLAASALTVVVFVGEQGRDGGSDHCVRCFGWK